MPLGVLSCDLFVGTPLHALPLPTIGAFLAKPSFVTPSLSLILPFARLTPICVKTKNGG